jgi:tetratricopeptide (TPR) repeat protein
MLALCLCALVASGITSTSAALELPVSGQPVSARTLTGDELVRIGELHDVQNHYPEALTYYDRALEAFRAHKQPKGEAIVLTKIGLMFERQGRRQEAAVHLRQALALFAKSPDSPVYADALYASGRVSLWVGSREDAASLFERAKGRYRRLHNVQAAGSVTLQSGLLKASDAASEEGLKDIDQVLAEARARRDQEQTLSALVALGDANWILDRPQAASTPYEQALAVLEQRPQAALEAGLRVRLAALNGAAGREARGIEFAKRAVTLYQSLHDVSGEAAAWSQLASLHGALGHDSEAEESLRTSLEIYRQQTLIVHPIRSAPLSATIAPREFR